MEIIFSLEEINIAATWFLKNVFNNKIFAFYGELGAGKTTFINALCKKMNIIGMVTSPTYSIIQEYRTEGGEVIYHMDLYRLKNREDAIEVGIEDCLSSNEICMVEWPGKAISIFPEKTVYTTIEVLLDNKRKLIVELPR